jgi:hypothetical protein
MRNTSGAARPGRVQLAALSATVPIALAVGVAFAVPIAVPIPHRPLIRSAAAVFADDCQSRAARVPLASDVTFGAAGAAKWPLCGGD